MKQRALSALWALRRWLGVIFLHVGWKLIGVHVSPGTIMLPNGKKDTK